MTDYKAIHGKNIKSLASDLDSAAADGQIWYNTTTGDFKTIVKVAGTWASGGNMGTARQAHTGGGTQTAGFAVGGIISTTVSALSEEYNGSAWAEGDNL